MTEPWYAEGLRFGCTRCGACCTGEPGFVWVNDTEIAAIAAFRDQSIEEFTQQYTRVLHARRTLLERPNGDCVFYDPAAGCTIYPVRPRQCRTWPFWGSNLATPEDWASTRSVCPGAGQGELIPVEDILRRVRTIRM